ncbi:MAG: hypothetical protein JW807_16680 [Spirochaetes bacterium]|nr:hypothetical protein [Spirochaetota bacterium]
MYNLSEDQFNSIMAALMAASKVMEVSEDKRLSYIGLMIDRQIDELEGIAAMHRPELKKVVENG